MELNQSMKEVRLRLQEAARASHRGVVALSINEQDAFLKYLQLLEEKINAWEIVPQAYGIMTRNPQAFILTMDRRGEAWERKRNNAMAGIRDAVAWLKTPSVSKEDVVARLTKVLDDLDPRKDHTDATRT